MWATKAEEDASVWFLIVRFFSSSCIWTFSGWTPEGRVQTAGVDVRHWATAVAVVSGWDTEILTFHKKWKSELLENVQ